MAVQFLNPLIYVHVGMKIRQIRPEVDADTHVQHVQDVFHLTGQFQNSSRRTMGSSFWEMILASITLATRAVSRIIENGGSISECTNICACWYENKINYTKIEGEIQYVKNNGIPLNVTNITYV